MKIIFDMDNTVVDELGATVRPGIVEFLEKLHTSHELVLWTNSGKARAKTILQEHKLIRYFKQCIYREDYDPQNRGICKDITNINGDYIIDDDPKEINFNRAKRKHGFLIKPYRKNSKPDLHELDIIGKEIDAISKKLKRFTFIFWKK